MGVGGGEGESERGMILCNCLDQWTNIYHHTGF